MELVTVWISAVRPRGAGPVNVVTWSL